MADDPVTTAAPDPRAIGAHDCPCCGEPYSLDGCGCPTTTAATVAERHQEHYRSCGCLSDSAECCDPTCPCGDFDATWPVTVVQHDHEWHDTGFRDLDECACGAMRSADTGRVIEAAELTALRQRVVMPDA